MFLVRGKMNDGSRIKFLAPNAVSVAAAAADFASALKESKGDDAIGAIDALTFTRKTAKSSALVIAPASTAPKKVAKKK